MSSVIVVVACLFMFACIPVTLLDVFLTCNQHLGLGLECQVFGFGLGLKCQVLGLGRGLGFGLECQVLGLGLGLGLGLKCQVLGLECQDLGLECQVLGLGLAGQVLVNITACNEHPSNMVECVVSKCNTWRHWRRC